MHSCRVPWSDLRAHGLTSEADHYQPRQLTGEDTEDEKAEEEAEAEDEEDDDEDDKQVRGQSLVAVITKRMKT